MDKTLMRKLLHLFLVISISAPLMAQGIMFGVTAKKQAATVTPASVAGLLFWFEANVGVTCTSGCSNGNVVTGWADQSSNANNLTCSASPTYVSSALNGLPGIAFVKASNQVCALGSQIAWGGTETFFVVEKVTSNSVQNGILGNQFSGSIYYRINSSAQQDILVGATAEIGQSTPTTLSAGTFYQSNVTYNSSTGAYAFRLARSANGSGTNAHTPSGNLSQLSPLGSAGDPFGGTIVEVFAYSTVVSGPNITALEGYLNTKYGI